MDEANDKETLMLIIELCLLVGFIFLSISCNINWEKVLTQPIYYNQASLVFCKKFYSILNSLLFLFPIHYV